MCVCVCRYCAISTQPRNQSQPWCASRCVCLVYQAAAAITRSSRLPHRRRLLTTCAVRGDWIVCRARARGRGRGYAGWSVSRMAKLRLAFWRIFMHVWLTSFFASFLFLLMGCGGNFNNRGQKQRPRLRPKLTRPPLPAHFVRLCALYGHNQTAAVHAALCAAVYATILQWICMNAT